MSTLVSFKAEIRTVAVTRQASKVQMALTQQKEVKHCTYGDRKYFSLSNLKNAFLALK
jgi:hypothetical protein